MGHYLRIYDHATRLVLGLCWGRRHTCRPRFWMAISTRMRMPTPISATSIPTSTLTPTPISTPPTHHLSHCLPLSTLILMPPWIPPNRHWRHLFWGRLLLIPIWPRAVHCPLKRSSRFHHSCWRVWLGWALLSRSKLTPTPTTTWSAHALGPRRVVRHWGGWRGALGLVQLGMGIWGARSLRWQCLWIRRRIQLLLWEVGMGVLWWHALPFFLSSWIWIIDLSWYCRPGDNLWLNRPQPKGCLMPGGRSGVGATPRSQLRPRSGIWVWVTMFVSSRTSFPIYALSSFFVLFHRHKTPMIDDHPLCYAMLPCPLSLSVYRYPLKTLINLWTPLWFNIHPTRPWWLWVFTALLLDIYASNACFSRPPLHAFFHALPFHALPFTPSCPHYLHAMLTPTHPNSQLWLLFWWPKWLDDCFFSFLLNFTFCFTLPLSVYVSCYPLSAIESPFCFLLSCLPYPSCSYLWISFFLLIYSWCLPLTSPYLVWYTCMYLVCGVLTLYILSRLDGSILYMLFVDWIWCAVYGFFDFFLCENEFLGMVEFVIASQCWEQ